jgi:hypothetical protein
MQTALNFTRGVLVDALLTAEREWWLRRAEDFERAKPTSGQFHGRAPHAELSAQWRRLDEAAKACRVRAGVCDPDRADADVCAVLEEAA